MILRRFHSAVVMAIRHRDQTPWIPSAIPGIDTMEIGCPGAKRGSLIARPRIRGSSRVRWRAAGIISASLPVKTTLECVSPSGQVRFQLRSLLSALPPCASSR